MEKDAENVNVIFMCAVKMRNEDKAKIIDVCKIWGIFDRLQMLAVSY